MKAIFGLAAVAVMLPLGLSAEETQGPASFQQLDMDRDGYVTIIEATGHTQLLRKWTAVDTDTDGRLEAAEFSAFEIEPTFAPPINPDDVDIGAAPRN
jgi:hypothetical protein